MFSQDQPPQQITSLHLLNTALLRLTPSITGIDMSMLQTKGANRAMLDAVIAANATTLYNGIKRADILDAIKTPLAAAVNTHPITYAYDAHGDKHFPGGPAGTKFTQGKAVVNPALQVLIGAQLGRIRRDANGKAQTYYYPLAAQGYTNGMPLCIQVDYAPGPPETITYHGYPDAGVVVLVLSRAKGGAAIAN